METKGRYQKIDNFLEKVNEVCNDNGVTIQDIVHDGNTTEVTFQFYSDAGEDFTFTIEINNRISDFGELVNELYGQICEYVDNYDISYETYQWLDQYGHGIGTAPYDMRDLYNDKESSIEKISKLADEINKLSE